MLVTRHRNGTISGTEKEQRCMQMLKYSLNDTRRENCFPQFSIKMH